MFEIILILTVVVGIFFYIEEHKVNNRRKVVCERCLGEGFLEDDRICPKCNGKGYKQK